jgi:hypothetical protein
MEYGFIHKPEDIKFLILYCLKLLPFAVTIDDIYAMASVDRGFDYFEFSQAFAELVDGKQISAVNTKPERTYIISESGDKIIQVMLSRIPPSVKDKADAKAIEIIHKIRRERSIRTSHIFDEPTNTYKAHLAVTEAGIEQFAIDVVLYSERQCYTVENVFKKKAERIFGLILDELSGYESKSEESNEKN